MLKPQKAKAILLAKIVIPLNKTQRSTPLRVLFLLQFPLVRFSPLQLDNIYAFCYTKTKFYQIF